MNYIDIVLAVFLIVGAIQGFRKGFVVEVASLGALVLGIWGAIKFSDWTSEFISKTFNYHSEYLRTISFLLIFVCIIVSVHLLGKMLDKMIKAVALGFLNRLAGVIFGILKTAVILSIFLLLFDVMDENVHLLPSAQKTESKIYEPMKQLVPKLFPFIKLWNWDEKDRPEKTAPDQKKPAQTT